MIQIEITSKKNRIKKKMSLKIINGIKIKIILLNNQINGDAVMIIQKVGMLIIRRMQVERALLINQKELVKMKETGNVLPALNLIMLGIRNAFLVKRWKLKMLKINQINLESQIIINRVIDLINLDRMIGHVNVDLIILVAEMYYIIFIY